MSIITEALKKVESGKRPVRVKPPHLALRSPGEKMFHGRRQVYVLISLGFLVIAGIGFYATKDTSRKVGTKALTEQPAAKIDPVKVTSPVSEVPAISASLYPEVREPLKLSGIMLTKDRPLAVINGSVRTEGETVNGLRIVEIREKYVKLLSDAEKETILRISR